MNASLAPASVAELVEIIRSSPRLLAVGAGTKPRLSAVDVTKVSTQRLQGIVEYEPSEFTFTAMAGTRLRDLAGTLAGRGQYLPFDPMFVEAGGTLGGAVAAGLSGPGRLRFGGIRDFILGTRLVDGLGRVLRMGGKVVKNAAGFDLPKFFVGSLGRFGVMAELTFKVFPAPVSTLTLKLPAKDVAGAARILMEAARTRWEPDALDIPAGDCAVLLRLAGPASALEQMAKDILDRWPGEKLPAADAQGAWSALREFRWAHAEGALTKVALTPRILPELHQALQPLQGIRVHVGGGGNVAYVSLRAIDEAEQLGKVLERFSLSGLALRGNVPLWCGKQSRPKIAQAVKHALDPENRFPALDD